MTDEITLTLNNPLTDEQWDAISDVDFDRTDRIWLHTKHGKEVEFAKVIRCKDCKHRPKIDEADVENYTASGFSLEFPDDYECPCRCEDPYYSWMPKDDWYCGNGERKEE